MDTVLIGKSLEEKEGYSKDIIQQTYDKYGTDVGIAFSGGKDSITLLHLVRSAFGDKIPWRVFTLDTGAEFKEIIDFVHRIAKKWDLDLITLRNDDALRTIEISKDKAECCYLLKAVPINNAIRDYKLKALLTAIRWDEQEDRLNEGFFTQRDNPAHVRVQPILHFKEIDIWTYIRKYNIPYCDLYRKGYRSIDCEPCTMPHVANGAERGGRAQDKEEVMKKLRQMGYF